MSSDIAFSETLERIVPDEITEGVTGQQTLQLHTDRYKFARNHLVGGTALDMACGVGYGTSILGKDNTIISRAEGVDISQPAIEYARRHYAVAGVSFRCDDALTYLPDYEVNNLVSLETVEHVEDPNLLFSRFVELIVPGGRLVCSVPVTPSIDVNPHHRTNFTVRSFERMAMGYPLRLVARLGQVQRFNPLKVLGKVEPRMQSLRPGLLRFYGANPKQLIVRIQSTLIHGFANKYLTVVWERTG